MDIEVVSVLVGTLVGVTATVAMAWINQKTLNHRELIETRCACARRCTASSSPNALDC